MYSDNGERGVNNVEGKSGPAINRGLLPASYQPLKRRLKPRLSTLAIAALTYRYLKAHQSSRMTTRLFQWIIVTLSVLNWRAVPFYWHVVTLWPIVVVKIRRKLLGTNEKFVKNLGLIGISPFEAGVVSKHCATWNACDFMLHLSNSSYAIALDEARCKWHVNVIGVAMRADQECVRSYVASTHFTYFVEIPMLADYEVEVRPVAWDNKWVYLLSVFTTAPAKGSKTRTLNCLSITRTVIKIGRRTVPPEKIFILCGFGKDETNWNFAVNLRKRPRDNKKRFNPSQEWLLNSASVEENDQSISLTEFESQRLRNLEIVRSGLDGGFGAERLKELL
ncbi:hypothetical protein PPACK8108_LOCUS9479 [Phakopsora pachyrhizi]|uniref:Uncharacterized protein n=1 Tax=Phakopsora pachyrhizi TaxID=170000 RepID=A0AAV0AYM0_PHAPC|nr:hypothetical protein PPACK8108_LOCUS9479 [Phakopsora pachyrhizi]